MQQIEVTITAKGEVQIHVVGAQGDSCLAVTKKLEEALGGQPLNRELTEEFYEQAEQTNEQTLTA